MMLGGAVVAAATIGDLDSAPLSWMRTVGAGIVEARWHEEIGWQIVGVLAY